ncbi:MAG: LCP family protein [Elusimicrobia bacterium]|nr:LCP family protein [Elusimicrobiota bacterium]
MKRLELNLKILVSRLFAFLVLSSVGATLWLSAQSPLARQIHRNRPVVALLVGTVKEKDLNRPETILLARYNPLDRSLNLLSIPRQTKVLPSQWKMSALTDVYTRSLRGNSPDPRFANQELFRAILELLSVSTESAQSLFWNTVPHACFLNMPEEDLQSLIRWIGEIPSFGEVSLSTASVSQLPWTPFPRKLSYLNLNGLEKTLLFWELRDLRKEEIHWLTIHGTVKNRILIPDTEEMRLTSKLFWSSKRGSGDGIRDRGETDRSKITVGVWNASDKKNVALDLARRLRRSGFDVVQWGNYPFRTQKGWVEDHSGQIEQARAIASLIYSSHPNVYTCVKNKSLGNMDVVVGDHDTIKEN